MQPFRLLMTTISVAGLILLTMVLMDWQAGSLAPEHFPNQDHRTIHHLGGLLLALPVPLHIIFIGLILQKRWLSPAWGRFAWVGIVTSGLWLGASLAYRMLT